MAESYFAINKLPLMASNAADVGEHHINGKLYAALMAENADKVIGLCRDLPERGLHVMTIHEDTVLHVAAYAGQKDLVLKLLDGVPNEQHLDKMKHKNSNGNTILHEAATDDRLKEAAEKMLKKAPELLELRNGRGETVLYRAARYGQTEMVTFFEDRIIRADFDLQASLRRTDNTNILHISILAEHFDLALKIAEKYNNLIGEEDEDKMTPLQLLSCNPSAFKMGSDSSELGLFMRLFYFIAQRCSSSWRETVEEEKKRCDSAVKLANFLTEKDISWKKTHSGLERSKPKRHKYGRTSVNPNDSFIDEKNREGSSSTASLQYHEEEQEQEQEQDRAQKSYSSTYSEKIGETPLFLATKSGILEIVERILALYPQAVEYIDDEGRTILHVAIKYRQLEIFKHVKKIEEQMRRLARKVDNKGNTILHTVAIERTDYVPEKMQGPALQLQQELIWFERVKKVTASHFLNHLNDDGHTAEGLFAKTNLGLRKEAKEWLKSTSEGCSLVAVLIATVAFAAAYTVPGGPNQNSGLPVLLYQPFFVVFTITDVLSLTFALTAVVTFLSILTSSCRMDDFKQSLTNKLILGITFLFLSVAMMMIAFAATLILMVNRKEKWTKIGLYATAFLPVGIFALSYFPLFLALSKTYEYLLKKAKKALLWGKTKTKTKTKTKWSKSLRRSQSTSSSISTRRATPPTPTCAV